MKSKNQKPTGQGGLRTHQFKASSKQIVMWCALNEYIAISFAEYFIQRGELSHG